MPFASGSRTQLAYVPEVVYGVCPAAPVFIAMRANFGIKPTIKRDTFPIKEIRQDRQITDLRYGNKQTALDLPFSLSYGNFDDMFEALLGGTWTANVLKAGNALRSFSMELAQSDVNEVELYTGMSPTSFSLKVEPNKPIDGCSFSFIGKDLKCAETLAASITVATTGKTITRAAGSFVTDGWETGMSARVDGGAAAGNAAVTFVNATTVTPTVLTFTSIVGGAGVNEGPVTMDVHMATRDTDQAYTAANSNPVFDSFTGSITEGGTPIAYVTGLDVKFESALDPSFAIMNDTVQQVTQGAINLTGTLSVYWVDQRLKRKFLAGAASSLVLVLGVTSKMYNINVPAIYFTGNDRSISEGAITESVPFQAVLDGGTSSNIVVTRTP